MTATAAPQPKTPLFTTLTFAAYLAASWTWCIGMFLPVLLVRDFGIWGFIVFAVPNCLGAAAMGWVLKYPESSRNIIESHRTACRWFSHVTIAYQCYFLGLLLAPGFGTTPSLILGSFWLLAMLGIRATARTAMERIIPAAACLATVLLLLSMLRRDALDYEFVLGSPSYDVLLLAPVCVFGFALCPYLDLTFHRARMSLPGGSLGGLGAAAFSLGFLVLFALAIVFTLGYRASVEWITQPRPTLGVMPVSIGIHIAVQLAVTTMLHRVESERLPAASRDTQRPPSNSRASIATALVMLAPLALGALCAVPFRNVIVADMRLAEFVYRCFLVFYGLIFPAYVWLCMIPTRDGHAGLSGPRGTRKRTVLIAACLLALPCYAMGFLWFEELWLAPGLGVVLLARLLVR